MIVEDSFVGVDVDVVDLYEGEKLTCDVWLVDSEVGCSRNIISRILNSASKCDIPQDL